VAAGAEDGRDADDANIEENDFEQKYTATAEVLAANGGHWSPIAPMRVSRGRAAAAMLPCGKVIVAGGLAGMGNSQGDNGNSDIHVLSSAEMWDPASNRWKSLPPMTNAQFGGSGCVLPSGRFAVIGGLNYFSSRAWQQGVQEPAGFGLNDFTEMGLPGSMIQECPGEVFDPVRWAWKLLPDRLEGVKHAPVWEVHENGSAVSVPGGMLLVGGNTTNANRGRLSEGQLYDEDMNRWFRLSAFTDLHLQEWMQLVVMPTATKPIR
jgi:hypothetical protein